MDQETISIVMMCGVMSFFSLVLFFGWFFPRPKRSTKHIEEVQSKNERIVVLEREVKIKELENELRGLHNHKYGDI